MNDHRPAVRCFPAPGSLLQPDLTTLQLAHPPVTDTSAVSSMHEMEVVTPEGADAAVWAAAIDVIRKPAPRYEGRFLHRDFQPGNVLFDLPPEDPAGAAGARITGVVDWAAASWGPADLDVVHCSTNLALLHGPVWGLRFTEAYQEAGGMLAAAADELLYWQVREPLAFSEEVKWVALPWWEAGRTELTTRVVRAAGRLCHLPHGRAGLSQGGPGLCPTSWFIAQPSGESADPGARRLLQGSSRRGVLGLVAVVEKLLRARSVQGHWILQQHRSQLLSELAGILFDSEATHPQCRQDTEGRRVRSVIRRHTGASYLLERCPGEVVGLCPFPQSTLFLLASGPSCRR